MQEFGWNDRRDLGQSISPQLYRYETFSDAGRDCGRAVLVDPPGRFRRSECSAGAMARWGPSIRTSSRRSSGARGAAMVGGVVPLALQKTWDMGGVL